MENLIEIKISYSAIFSWGTSRVLFSSLESVVLNGWTHSAQDNLCKMFRYTELNTMRGVRAILVWLSEYMGQLSSSRWYLLDLLLTLAWKMCSSCCSDCIYWLQHLYSGSMTETLRTEYSFIYLVKLSLTASFLMAALNFVSSYLRCSSVTYIIILSHTSVHSTGVRSPISTFAFEFSEWCYYVTTFGFQNHILGLWHGDESWFWNWGHVINMTKLCNVEMMSVHFRDWISLIGCITRNLTLHPLFSCAVSSRGSLCNACWFSKLALFLSVPCTRVVWCFCIINILHNLQLLQRFSHVLHMSW
jgi:hypothetical protein